MGGGTDLPHSLRESLDSTKVSYTQLGNSGLRVSIPILGCMSFGHKDWQPWVNDNADEVDAILKGAFDRGLNTWDTANVYSNGLSESLIGDTIKKHKIPRHKLVLLSKCLGPVGEEPNVHVISYPDEIGRSKDYVNQQGLSRTAIFNQVEASLERLGTKYLDLLQIHRFDKTVPIEETMKALHDLVQSGKVRYIGASSMWAYQLAQMQHVAERHGWTKFVSMQNQYNVCYREEEREMNPYCHETGVGLIPWAPLYRGLLARPLRPDATASNKQTESTRQVMLKGNPVFGGLHGGDVEIIGRVQELADRHQWKMSQVALAWVIQKGAIPIVGASSLSRLEEACEVRGKTLTEEEIKYLEEPYKPRAIVGHM